MPISTLCRLMQDDIDISLKAKQYKIPVLYVRSKADQVHITIVNCHLITNNRQLQVKRLDIKVIKNLYGQQRLENSCWK